MDTTRLGNTGLQVSRICLGCMTYGVPQAQVALAWMLQKPGITAPIIGASKPTQLDDAVAALKIELHADEVAALEAPYLPHAVVGFE